MALPEGRAIVLCSGGSSGSVDGYGEGGCGRRGGSWASSSGDREGISAGCGAGGARAPSSATTAAAGSEAAEGGHQHDHAEHGAPAATLCGNSEEQQEGEDGAATGAGPSFAAGIRTNRGDAARCCCGYR